MILMLVVMAAIISGLGVVKFKQIQTAIAQGAAFQPPPEAVTTVVAKEDRWPSTLNAVGSAAAVQGVTVSADLPGTVDRVAFDSGRAVQAGDVLSSSTRARSARSSRRPKRTAISRKVNFDRMEGLLNESVISKAEYDKAASERKQTEAKVGEIEAMIARKTIKAPFTGILGIRQVNRGQYLKAGDPIVGLQALNPIYVNFDVPQQDAEQVRVGRAVQVTAKDVGGTTPFAGRSPRSTRSSTRGRATCRSRRRSPTRRASCAPACSSTSRSSRAPFRRVIALPASAISYAPFGDSVFIVTDMKTPDGKAYKGVRQQFVKVGATRGDQVDGAVGRQAER